MLLVQVQRWHPQTKLLLRIRADDTQARCQLGNKFGADPVDALGEHLAAEAAVSQQPAGLHKKMLMSCACIVGGLYIVSIALW